VIRLHRLVPVSAAEGPGRRAALWVQGCSIRCVGCFNPHTWNADGGELVSVDELATVIERTSGIEGVTFLGGEPFDQARPLAELGARCRDSGLSVMTFSGHTLERLQGDDIPGARELLAVTDLLVDGPFDAARPDRLRPWVGSTNQRFVFLTDRYRHLEQQLHAIPDRLEVRLHRDGTIWVNGMASASTLQALRADLRAADR
jgi:anaerobic ribonucleoside-triphosphate reductase activating protein